MAGAAARSAGGGHGRADLAGARGADAQRDPRAEGARAGTRGDASGAGLDPRACRGDPPAGRVDGRADIDPAAERRDAVAGHRAPREQLSGSDSERRAERGAARPDLVLAAQPVRRRGIRAVVPGGRFDDRGAARVDPGARARHAAPGTSDGYDPLTRNPASRDDYQSAGWTGSVRRVPAPSP